MAKQPKIIARALYSDPYAGPIEAVCVKTGKRDGIEVYRWRDDRGFEVDGLRRALPAQRCVRHAHGHALFTQVAEG